MVSTPANDQLMITRLSNSHVLTTRVSSHFLNDSEKKKQKQKEKEFDRRTLERIATIKKLLTIKREQRSLLCFNRG